jgi:hypothetical protein
MYQFTSVCNITDRGIPLIETRLDQFLLVIAVTHATKGMRSDQGNTRYRHPETSAQTEINSFIPLNFPSRNRVQILIATIINCPNARPRQWLAKCQGAFI